MFPGNYVELVKDEEPKKEEPKKEEPKKEEKKDEKKAVVPAASPAATSAPSGGFVCGPGEKKVKVLLPLFPLVRVADHSAADFVPLRGIRRGRVEGERG